MKCDICGQEDIKNLGVHKYQKHREKESIVPIKNIWIDFCVGDHSTSKVAIKKEILLTTTGRHDCIDRHLKIELHGQLEKAINEVNKIIWSNEVKSKNIGS